MKTTLRHALRTVAPVLLSSWIRKKWEHEPEYSLLPALCDSNRISVDVGANWGQYVGALCDLSAGVVACEPVPQLARFLRRSYGEKVRVEQVALSNIEGEADFVIQADWGKSSLGGCVERGGRRFTVSLKTFDSIAAHPVGFIKIDVEGREEEVIEGALAAIGRDHPVLLTEIEERHRPGALARIPRRLFQEGYAGFFLHQGRVLDIAKFRIAEHQPSANISPTGEARYGTYINNFIFIHQSDLAAKTMRLAELGYPVVD